MKEIKVLIIICLGLVVIQSCKKEHIKDNLTGKIKTSDMIFSNGIDSGKLKYNFIYYNSDKLQIIVFSSTLGDSVYPQLRYFIEYGADKVVVRDSVYNGKTYYLQSGTNLVDSVIGYDHGSDLGGNKVLRDALGNVTKIEPARALGLLSTYSFIDSFVYDGNNLKSFKINFIGFGTTSVARFEIEHDLTQLKRTDNDMNILYPLNGTFDKININDLSILGLSMGNAYSNAIASVKYVYYDGTPDYAIHYSYPVNSANKLSVNLTPSMPSPHIKHMENTYYP